MRINNNCNTSITCLNLIVHLLYRNLSKICWVKFEVLIVSHVILISPVNIHPQNVNWEFVLSKKTISLHNHIGIDVCPFAKMISKSVYRWYNWVS